MLQRTWRRDGRGDSASSPCEDTSERLCARSPRQDFCRRCCAKYLCNDICTRSWARDPYPGSLRQDLCGKSLPTISIQDLCTMSLNSIPWQDVSLQDISIQNSRQGLYGQNRCRRSLVQTTWKRSHSSLRDLWTGSVHKVSVGDLLARSQRSHHDICASSLKRISLSRDLWQHLLFRPAPANRGVKRTPKTS